MPNVIIEHHYPLLCLLYVSNVFKIKNKNKTNKINLEICSKFKGEQSCQSVIPMKLQSSFIEIILRHGCSPGCSSAYLTSVNESLFTEKSIK